MQWNGIWSEANLALNIDSPNFVNYVTSEFQFLDLETGDYVYLIGWF